MADSDTDQNGPHGRESIIALNRSWKVMSSNTAARDLLGMALNLGDPIPLERICAASSLPRLKEALDATLDHGCPQEKLTVRSCTGREAQTDLQCAVHPLLTPEGNTFGAILSIRPASLVDASHPSEPPAPEPNSLDNMLHRDLLEALPEGVFTINTRWRIVSFNSRAEEITGFRREEVIGHYCWEIFRSDLCNLACPLRTALDTGRTRMDQDVRILKKEGTRQTILVNAGVLRDSDGQITGAVETFRPLAGERYLPKAGEKRVAFSEIIGRSSAMQQIIDMLPDIAASDANVLITGESGTGKDLIARAIHDHSTRAGKPFVAVNCSALAESLLESELFGHEKAAFTGATHNKTGRFEMARGGTLFLDEIGELKPELQIKLLRVLEQHEFERVGGTRTLPMEARIISATNRDLRKAIHQGQFREDFYYRLRTVPLNVPPLRQRPDDIPMLVDYFIQRFNARYKKRVISIHPDVMKMFLAYDWPGNVRELERTLEHTYVFVKGPTIRARDLPAAEEFQPLGSAPAGVSYEVAKPLNADAIRRALSQSKGNRKEAAQLLGMSRTTLWRRMKQLGMTGIVFH